MNGPEDNVYDMSVNEEEKILNGELSALEMRLTRLIWRARCKK